MKLLYLANLRLPTEKAYGIQIAKTCEAFADCGLDLLLLYPNRNNKIKEDIFSYFSVKNNFKTKKLYSPDFYWPGSLDKFSFHIKNFVSAVALSVFALRNKFDVIYSRDELIIFLLSFFKSNLVFEAHRLSKQKMLFYRWFKIKNTKIVAITKSLKRELCDIGFSGEDILVAPDGVDLREFDLSLFKNEARLKVGLPQDKKIIMYTGHLFGWKGAQILLQTARNFQPDDALFVFVGGTEFDVKNFREKAEGLNNVWILGHSPRREVPLYLKAADVLILPNSAKYDVSSKYTSPLKLFEYMASGRPIVASDLASVREVLNDKNAILVKPDDPGNLAEGIAKIFRDNFLGERLTEEARKNVKDYTWTKRTASILNFIG